MEWALQLVNRLKLVGCYAQWHTDRAIWVRVGSILESLLTATLQKTMEQLER